MKEIVMSLLLFLAFSSLDAQEVQLKIKRQKGDDFLVKGVVYQRANKMGGMTMRFDLNTKTTSSQKNQFTTESKMKKLVVDVSQGGATYRYDSDVKNPTSQMARVFKSRFDPMLKVNFIQVSDRFGGVISAKAEPPIVSSDVIGFQFGYPKEPVKVGSIWTSKMMNTTAGVIKLTYTVTKITSTTVYAEIKGQSSDYKTMKLNGSIEINIATGNPSKVLTKTTILSTDGKITGKTELTYTKI